MRRETGLGRRGALGVGLACDWPPRRHSVRHMLGESDGAAWLQAFSSLFQAIALGVGGFWALYLYRTARKGRASLGIEQEASVIPIAHATEGGVLVVRLRISNLSGVLFRHDSSVAT